MVDTVLKQSRTPPRSPIRALPKVLAQARLRRSRSQRIACDTCEPQVASKSARRVCVLRYLVSSCAIGYTNRVFAVAAVLKSRFLLSHPLISADPEPDAGRRALFTYILFITLYECEYVPATCVKYVLMTLEATQSPFPPHAAPRLRSMHHR